VATIWRCLVEKDEMTLSKFYYNANQILPYDCHMDCCSSQLEMNSITPSKMHALTQHSDHPMHTYCVPTKLALILFVTWPNCNDPLMGLGAY